MSRFDEDVVAYDDVVILLLCHFVLAHFEKGQESYPIRNRHGEWVFEPKAAYRGYFFRKRVVQQHPQLTTRVTTLGVVAAFVSH